jgi:hypothetical protein
MRKIKEKSFISTERAFDILNKKVPSLKQRENKANKQRLKNNVVYFFSTNYFTSSKFESFCNTKKLY